LKIKAKIVLLFKYFAHRSYKYNYDSMNSMLSENHFNIFLSCGRLKELYDGPVDIELTG
jgi:hypothetical protein